MARLQLELKTNEEALGDELRQFIAESANGTLHHTPHFLSYHSSEKLDASGVDLRHIIFRKGQKVVGHIPGALVRTEGRLTHASPWGASVGGLVVRGGTPYAQVDDMVRQWRDLLVEWQVDVAKVTLTPRCFQSVEGLDGVEFAMLRYGFRPTESPMLLATPIQEQPDFPASVQDNDARRRTRKAVEDGCVVEVTHDVDRFWPILAETMDRNSAEPTHSRAELRRLLERFPDDIRILLCCHEGVPVAGVLVMRMNRVAETTFYICSRSDARPLNPVNLLITSALERATDSKWLDFGPSTFGYEPHETLIRFKQQNGAVPFLRRRFEWAATEEAD